MVVQDNVDDHVTGCARSEGYYKIDMRDKVKYLPHHTDRPKDAPQQKQKVSLYGIFPCELLIPLVERVQLLVIENSCVPK